MLSLSHLGREGLDGFDAPFRAQNEQLLVSHLSLTEVESVAEKRGLQLFSLVFSFLVELCLVAEQQSLFSVFPHKHKRTFFRVSGRKINLAEPRR